MKKQLGKKKINTGKNKPVYNGITFDSKLEVYCYKQLENNKIEFKYTPTTFTLVNPFTFSNTSYEPNKTSGDLLYRKSPKLQSIKYTPDFIGNDWIIETKGRQNESFPMRFKLFKKFLTDNNIKYDLYLPKNQKQVDYCINLILDNGRINNI